MRPPQAVSAMETDSLRDLRRSEIWVRRSWSWAGGKDWVGFCSCWGGEGSVDVEDDMFFCVLRLSLLLLLLVRCWM